MRLSLRLENNGNLNKGGSLKDLARKSGSSLLSRAYAFPIAIFSLKFPDTGDEALALTQDILTPGMIIFNPTGLEACELAGGCINGSENILVSDKAPLLIPISLRRGG
jgi:hypothetical protein